MTIATHLGFNPVSTYVHLENGGGAVPVEADSDFWGQLGRRAELHEGRLVCAFHLTHDWKEWEMHPEGDEILYLLSGALDLILEDRTGERLIELRPGAACIVPRGIWHRVNIRRASKGLFITPGKGTQHRPV